MRASAHEAGLPKAGQARFRCRQCVSARSENALGRIALAGQRPHIGSLRCLRSDAGHYRTTEFVSQSPSS
jgi:hypothetical protein